MEAGQTCVLAGSEGGPLEPAEYKEGKREKAAACASIKAGRLRKCEFSDARH